MKARWFETLADLYGTKLEQEEQRRWAEYFKRDLRGITEAELIEGLFWSARSYERKRAARPAYADVLEMMRAYRRSKGEVKLTRNEVHTLVRVEHLDGTWGWQVRETTMQELKFELKRATPEQAWELICRPQEVEQCRELEDYCRERGIRYDKPKFDLVGELERLQGSVDVHRRTPGTGQRQGKSSPGQPRYVTEAAGVAQPEPAGVWS